VCDTSEGCAALHRDLDRLEKGADRNLKVPQRAIGSPVLGEEQPQ